MPDPARESRAAPRGSIDPDVLSLHSSDRTRLSDNTARRKPADTLRIIWDDDLPGFGLRIRPSGHKSWILMYRRRGELHNITLGQVKAMPATTARVAARRMLAEAATDGLPRRVEQKRCPTFAEFAPLFWQDYARHWKPLTERGNRTLLSGHLLPTFGAQRLDQIARSDVLRWRDTMAGTPGSFKNALPVLSVMLRYAEQLGYRRRGSNPCRGVPRFKAVLKERYLTADEFMRLGRVLDGAAEWPVDIDLVRLLIFTGARVAELTSLQWRSVEPDRLRLPDSKTGPKYIYLNRQAQDLLIRQNRESGSPFVFPNRKGTGPHRHLGRRWRELRRRAAIPDVRLHDLRHTFASVAINGNIPLATIGKLLGHELPETTSRYAHLMDECIADAAQRVCSGIARDLGLAV